MNNNFEEWLEEKFSEDFTGSKDDWEDSLDRWFSNLDVQEVIDYAQEWGNQRVMIKH